MIRRWLVFWAGLVVLLGGATGAAVTLDRQAVALRGWADATRTLDLPLRLPLAGVNVELTQYDDAALERELARIEAAGFHWVRQSVRWDQIEPERGALDWTELDRIVAAVAEQPKLALVAVIDGAPRWARHPLAPDHPFAPPESVGDYAAFAGAVAARYADAIDYYQVWDEPNLKSHWGGMDPRPAHYVAMLRGAYDAIHDADPQAQVIAAALAPTVETGPDNLSDVLYLRAIYEQGGQGAFDAAAGKPYGYNTGPYDRRVADDTLNFSRLILLREEMVRRGDGTKPLWGSNFGWNHLPEGWRGPPSIWGQVSAAEQAQFTRDAYQRATREWPWIGGLIVQHWQPDAPPDDPQQGFAVAPVIDEWLADGLRASAEGLPPGLHPVQNAYTAYSENWRFSELGADAVIHDPAAVTPDMENRIAVTFAGTDFAISVRRDDTSAYLFVTVDGAPANALPRQPDGQTFLLLTSPDRAPRLDLIAVARGLADGVHTVEIVHRPINGDDRWPIAGYAVAHPADTGLYRLALAACAALGALGLAGMFGAGRRLPWRALRWPSAAVIRHAIEWLISLLASLLVLAGALLTWGEPLAGLLRRDPPALALTILTAGVASLSPAALVTLVALGALFVLIYNRPILGLMLIIFWSAFFLSTLDLLFRLFATVEVYLVLTAGALALRGLVEGARRYRAGARMVSWRWPRLTALDWLALAWAGLGVLSLSWARYRSPALHELRVVILDPVLFYALIRLMRLERRDLAWLADTLVFSGAAIALAGLVWFVSGHGVVVTEEGARRLISIYGSPNGVGLYLGRGLPFALAYALLPLGAWRRAFGVAGGALMLIAILLSQSRGAILLGLPAGVIALLIVWRGRRAAAPVAAALAAIAVVLVPLSIALPRLRDLLGETAFFRRHLWYSALNLIREHPITGAGLDQFLYWYRSRYLLPDAWAEPNLSIPHNVLLNHWVSLGLGGVLLGVAFQVAFWRGVWRARGRLLDDHLLLALALGLAGSMAHALAHGLVDVSYFSINLAFVFFLSLGLLHHLERLADEKAAE